MDNSLALSWQTPDSVWQGMLRQDFRSWLDIQEEKVIQDAKESTGLSNDLMREAFLGLFVPTAPMRDPEPENMGHLASIFRRAEEMQEWKGLRQVTGEDEAASAIGAASFAVEMFDKLPPDVQEKIKEAEEKNKEAQERGQEAKEMQDLLAQLPKDSPAATDLKKKASAKEREAKRAKAEATQANAELERSLQNNQAQVQRAIAEASQAGSGEVQELQGAAEALGGDGEPGGWGLGRGAGGKQSIGTLQKLADYLKQNKQLRKMLKELGWAKQAVSEQIRKSKYGRAYFTHYQTRELDFETLCPDEMLGLVMPAGHPARMDFLRRAGDDELLHRKFSGDEKAGRGPLIRVRDTSGSMMGPPHALQSAFDLALTQQMQKEGRKVIWITFSGPGQYDVWEPGKQTTLEEIVGKVEFGYWGGTEPYGPLKKAIEIIRADPSMKRGDILITTDGMFETPPKDFLKDLAEARKEPGLRLVALVIASNPGAADFADSVQVVQDLLSEREKLSEALGEVL
jgi:uncharacterized protein with von Willebrand factor type A (vWA) domain